MFASASIASGQVGASTGVGFSASGLVDGTGNMFMQVKFAELGARPNGSFGSDSDAPAAYHPRTNNARQLGFVSDRDRDGWGVGVDDGDFFTPGYPFEGWGLQLGASGPPQYNSVEGTTIPGTWAAPVDSATAISAVWTAEPTSDGVGVSKRVSLGHDGQVLHTEVTLTNTTDATIGDLYYMRGVDPDNCRMATTPNVCDSDGDGISDSSEVFDTHDTIVDQYGESGSTKSLVSAEQTDGSWLGLSSLDQRARVMLGQDPYLTNLAAAYDGSDPSMVSTKGAARFDDSYIFLVVGVDSLAAGASTSFVLSYSLADLPRATSTSLTESIPSGAAATFDPIAATTPGEGTSLDASSVLLRDPADGIYKHSVTVSGEGVWTADAATGITTFVPEAAFVGTSTPISYQVTDSNFQNSGAALTAIVAASRLPDVDGSYQPLPPARAVDTRHSTTLTGGEVRQVALAGRFGIPADATAVVLNATATRANEAGYLTVYPCGIARPETSNVNFGANQDVANGVTVKLGSDGAVCVASPTDTDFILDVVGAFGPTTSSRLKPLAPSRLLDTRQSGTKPSAGSTTELVVAGLLGVPSNAVAAALNLTVTDPEAAGYLVVSPCGTTGEASSLNFAAGATVANLVVSKLGAGGKVCVTSTSTSHLIVDITAAFVPDATLQFEPQDPARLLDTRRTQRVEARKITEVFVGGRGGVPAAATAASLNVTVTEPAGDGYLVVFPCGAAVPSTSHLNFVRGATVGNSAHIGLTEGKVCVMSTVDAHVIVDAFGGYVPIES